MSFCHFARFAGLAQQFVLFFLLGGLAVAAACAERVVVWPLSIPPEHPTLLRAGFFFTLGLPVVTLKFKTPLKRPF
jgi:hypothetical protein